MGLAVSVEVQPVGLAVSVEVQLVARVAAQGLVLTFVRTFACTAYRTPRSV